jgi:hypothetical protein
MGTGLCRSFGAHNAELFLPAKQQAELSGAATAWPTIDFRFSSRSVGLAELTIFEKSSAAKLGPFVEQPPPGFSRHRTIAPGTILILLDRTYCVRVRVARRSKNFIGLGST